MADNPSELKHGVLGLGDAFAESFALLSLALASSLATSVVAANAGVAAPWAYIVAGAGSLCLASVIIRFTRRMASAGGVYTYTSRGLGAGGGLHRRLAVRARLRRRNLVRDGRLRVLPQPGARRPRGHSPRARGLVLVLFDPARRARGDRPARHPRVDADPAGDRDRQRGGDRAPADHRARQGRRLGDHARAVRPRAPAERARPVPRRGAGLHRLHRVRGGRGARRGGGRSAARDPPRDPDRDRRRDRLLRVPRLGDGRSASASTTSTSGRPTRPRSTRSRPATPGPGWRSSSTSRSASAHSWRPSPASTSPRATCSRWRARAGCRTSSRGRIRASAPPGRRSRP